MQPAPVGLPRQNLCLRLWPQLARNGPDEAGIESQLAKECADVAKGHCRRIQFEINDIVVAIDFVAKAGEMREFLIELEDLVQITDARSVNFKFEHRAKVEAATRRCKIRLPGASSCRPKSQVASASRRAYINARAERVGTEVAK